MQRPDPPPPPALQLLLQEGGGAALTSDQLAACSMLLTAARDLAPSDNMLAILPFFRGLVKVAEGLGVLPQDGQVRTSEASHWAADA